MKYMGSKNRIAKYIVPILEKIRGNRVWVEPFVGGGNMIDKVGGERIGNDNQPYVIALLKAMQNGWIPPKEVSLDFFNLVKNNKNSYPKELVGYLGTQLTFGCEWWGSFRRDNTGKRKYDIEAFNNITKQSSKLNGVIFTNQDYKDLILPPNSFIYCDPPYAGVRKYVGNSKFNNSEFWDWCRSKHKEGHIICVSEYSAPEDFKCIWEMEIPANANNSVEKGKKSRAVEKLFTL